jgi:hypothetical protein
VRAYKDEDNDDEPDPNIPDGGSELQFDFPFHPDSSLLFNLNADITNLFYWNNLMHDWSYKFGFNEAAGNFQFNNFNNGGSPEDHVEAQTLDGGDTGNANFSAPRDGINGRMQMYKWLGGSAIDVTGPNNTVSNYNAGSANFGPLLNKEIKGKIVLADDNIGDSFDACESILNTSAVSNNIALIDRGTCHFSAKVYRAQLAGASACIICNNVVDGGLVSMSPGDNASQVNIPSVFLTKEDCDIIKAMMSAGFSPEATFFPVTEISSSFDNGIVVHEYGHGISLRLVGGAANSGCLNNDEQMGEGWSDFFALVMTQQADDLGSDPRGIGSYALGEEKGGRGIRRHRYSTDMNINRQLHSHIRATTRPHPVGEVWATVLWDIYWDMIEAYGYDPTWTNRESGNFKTLQLVIDGMKIQGCNAGLIDARDAIFSADLLNNSGENECLLWKAFARRGFGLDASQGSKGIRTDNTDGFKLPATCRNDFEVISTVSPYVKSKDTVDITILINNYTNVSFDNAIVNILIPRDIDLLSYPNDAILSSENLLSFEIGNLKSAQANTLNLKAAITAKPALGLFLDDFQDSTLFIFSKSTVEAATWEVNALENDSNISASIIGDTKEGESYLTYQNELPITSSSNLLKFRHKFNTELGLDGGIIQFSFDQGNTWQNIERELFIANGYNEYLTYDILYNDTRPAYSGSQDWKIALIDLSKYMGQTMMLRFNYTQQFLVNTTPTTGWIIDDIEVLEKSPITLTGEVISSNQSPQPFTFSTHVASDFFATPTFEIIQIEDYFSVSPSPAEEQITLNWQSDKNERITIQLYTANGQVIFSQNYESKNGQNSFAININNLAAGSYFVKMANHSFTSSRLFIKI